MPNPSAPLRNRLDFEALIAETSAALISVAPDQIDAVVESALERLRALASHDMKRMPSLLDKNRAEPQG
jgi:hypothetical protein